MDGGKLLKFGSHPHRDQCKRTCAGRAHNSAGFVLGQLKTTLTSQSILHTQRCLAQMIAS